MRAPAHALRLGWLLIAALLLAACRAEPDVDQVSAALQERLDATFGGRILDVASVRRAGSGALPAAEDGATRRLVYFHGRFELVSDYDFTAWNSLNLSSLANLLGATDRGVQGIASGGNRAGDELRVYGTLELVQRGDAWEPVVAARPAAPGRAIETAGPGQPRVAQTALDRLKALADRPPARRAEKRRAIVDEEIERAVAAIELRLDRLDKTTILAGGPPGGAYAGVAEVIARSLSGRDHGVAAVATEGSLDNLARLRTGSVDLALVQSDLAALAHSGQGAFAGQRPMTGLRALASLFPEALHLVVRADAGIGHVRDLAGKRVDIGLPGSGTRVHARAVLSTAGLTANDLTEAREEGLAAALKALEAGRLDAFFTTVNAPAPQIQRLAAKGRIRLLSLDEATVAALRREEPYLVASRLPLGTYPGVPEPITTVAVAALLATTDDLPADTVDRVLRGVFGQIDFARAGSSAGSQVSRRTARDGLSIPLHEAAERFLDSR
jgi:TRAP transporter TAXI family solute receptor